MGVELGYRMLCATARISQDFFRVSSILHAVKRQAQARSCISR